jgi:hypothetical protein
MTAVIARGEPAVPGAGLAGAVGAVATAADRADPGGGVATAVAEEEEAEDDAADEELADSARSFFASDFSGDLATEGSFLLSPGILVSRRLLAIRGPVAGYPKAASDR